MALLQMMLVEGRPHPTGSAAQARIRDRIVGHLRGLGLAPSIQSQWICSAGGRCAFVDNVFVQLPGELEGRGVLVSGHYDSVGTSPGAADDGHAIAIMLELAQMLSLGPSAKRRAIGLLFTDGEEVGLMGARAFVQDNPAAPEFDTVINLEAGGTAGMPIVFEVSADATDVLDVAAETSGPLLVSSVPAEFVRTAGSSTDLSALQRGGLRGLSIGFVGHSERVHTPLDDIAALDPRSVQAQGEVTAELVQALATRSVDPVEATRAVYAELGGFMRLSLPRAWCRPATLLGCGACVLLAAVEVRRRRVRSRHVLIAWAGFVVVVGVVSALAFAIAALQRRTGVTAEIRPALVCSIGVALVVHIGVARWVARRVDAHAGWLGGWLGWSCCSMVAMTWPALAPMFVVPLGTALFGRGLAAIRPGLWLFAALGGPVTAALLWLPLALATGPGLGWAGPLLAIPAAALAQTQAFAVAPIRWPRIARALGFVVICGSGILAMRSAFDSPRHATLVYVERTPTDVAELGVTPQPPADIADAADIADVARRGDFEPPRRGWLPWTELPAWTMPVTAVGLPPPLVESAPGMRASSIRLHIRSGRGARRGFVLVPAQRELSAARVEGHVLVPNRMRHQQSWRIVITGWPNDGIDVELEFEDPVGPSSGPLELQVVDCSDGLPPALIELALARDRVAVPRGAGDQACAAATVSIEAVP